MVNLNSIWIPASNYYNPFGPVTFADGTRNPNRLPNLVNVPTQGLPVRLGSYRFVDAGFQDVDVKNYQSRFVAGLRGGGAERAGAGAGGVRRATAEALHQVTGAAVAHGHSLAAVLGGDDHLERARAFAADGARRGGVGGIRHVCSRLVRRRSQ